MWDYGCPREGGIANPRLSHPPVVQVHSLVQHLKLGYRFPMGQTSPETRDKISSTAPIAVKTGRAGGGVAWTVLWFYGGAHFPWKEQWEQHPNLERGLLLPVPLHRNKDQTEADAAGKPQGLSWGPGT